MQWYGANSQNPQVINYLIGAQRNCGTRSIRRNPLVCCDRPVSSNIPQPQPTEVPITQAPPTEPWRTTPPTTTTTQATTTEKIARYQEERCFDPKGNDGFCRSIRECPHILQQFVARQNDPSYIGYIRQSNAACNYVQPNVCCSKEETVTETTTSGSVAVKGRLLTPEEGCGGSNTTLTRVVGGQPAKIGGKPTFIQLRSKFQVSLSSLPLSLVFSTFIQKKKNK